MTAKDLSSGKPSLAGQVYVICPRCNTAAKMSFAYDNMRCRHIIAAQCSVCNVGVQIQISAELAKQAKYDQTIVMHIQNELENQLPIAFAEQLFGSGVRNTALTSIKNQLDYWKECEVPELRDFETDVLRGVNGFFRVTNCPFCYVYGIRFTDSKRPVQKYMNTAHSIRNRHLELSCPICLTIVKIDHLELQSANGDKLAVDIPEQVRRYVQAEAKIARANDELLSRTSGYATNLTMQDLQNGWKALDRSYERRQKAFYDRLLDPADYAYPENANLHIPHIPPIKP